MPLSKPVRRQHLHSREILCRGFKREDGLWDIEARLVDTKTYSFDNADREGIRAGEPIHEMAVRLTVDDNLAVQDIEVSSDHGPFSICAGATANYRTLRGLSIGPGWKKEALERVGAAKGCTHITDLIVGPLAVAAIHTVHAARDKLAEPRDGGKSRPPLLESCHAFAADSPVT
ncbi:MAG: DUF2889 domain-containing protein, partial [Alphaproteobacteria bacterium]|nr:DUF2889 domain-containing protein [Alphaproteobacteria bacterium]